MKTTITSLLVLLVLISDGTSGTVSSSAYSGKGTVGPAPEPPCFGTGFNVGIFGAGFLPRHEAGNFENSLGGGVLAEYFFTENIGLQFSYGAYATEGTTHVINGDLVLRAPIQSICVAPYLLLGGGFNVDGNAQGEIHAGVGVEAKIKALNNLSVFADGTYNWHNDSNRDRDFTLVRVGLKFHL